MKKTIKLSFKHIGEICKFGQGERRCKYLVCGQDGLKCAKHTISKEFLYDGQGGCSSYSCIQVRTILEESLDDKECAALVRTKGSENVSRSWQQISLF